MPLLVEHDTERAQLLVAQLPVGTQVVGNNSALETALSGRHDEYVVVLGPDLPMTDAAALADRLGRSHPQVAVLLLRHHPGPEDYAEAMRAGIRGVHSVEDSAGLGASIARLKETWEAINGPSMHGSSGDGPSGKVITVFSPKGGVGKTTVAVNLAFALRAAGAQRVCVVDLDLAFGDVAITLQLVPQHTVAEAVGVEDHIDYALLDRLLTRHEDGVAVLAAPTSPESKDRIPPGMVRSVLHTLRHNFEYVVVDTAPGFEDHVLQAFDETDECVLMATLDVPTLKNVKVAIETLDLLDLARDHRHLLLNRADEEVGLSIANVEGILGMQVAASMPSSLAVANATNHGRPIMLEKPDHPVSKSISGLAKALMSGVSVQQHQQHATDAAEEKRGGLFGRRKKAGSRRNDGD